MSTFADNFGDGSDGAYTGGSLVKGQEYNFTTFDLNAPITLGAGDGKKIIVRVQGNLTLGASAQITSGNDTREKDSDTVEVGGLTQSVASIDGDNGVRGVGGSGGGGGAGRNGSGGSGGQAGSAGNAGGTGYTIPYVPYNNGGDAGTYPAGTGGAGGFAQFSGGGGGGGGGQVPYVHNGIIFIVGGILTVDGSIVGNGSNGGRGGSGGAGGAAFYAS